MNPSLPFNVYLDTIAQQRALLQRIFFILALVGLLLNYRYHLSLFQIGANPLLYQEVDPTYWLFMSLKLPQLITVRFPLLFDGLLLLACVCSILWPRQNRSAIAFFALHFIYFVLYNMLAGHHYINTGLLFMSFPFVFSSGRSVAFAFAFVRLIFCFMMATAALWKIGRGTLFHTEQVAALLLPGHIAYSVSGSGSLRAIATAWLLQHPPMAHLAWVVLIFLEAVFAVGFFTLRYDRLLLLSYLLFVAGGWALFDIYNYENLLFLLALAPVVKAVQLFQKPMPWI